MKEFLQQKRNECLNLVRPSNRKVNEIRFSSGESQEHISMKCAVCEDLRSNHKLFVTEAIIDNDSFKGLRVDVLCLDDFLAIEIQHSESDESINTKHEILKLIGLKLKVVKC